MAVANPKEVPEYELNPLELQVRRADGIAKARSFLLYCPFFQTSFFRFLLSTVND